jgi:hypothetical protein
LGVEEISVEVERVPVLHLVRILGGSGVEVGAGVEAGSVPDLGPDVAGILTAAAAAKENGITGMTGAGGVIQGGGSVGLARSLTGEGISGVQIEGVVSGAGVAPTGEITGASTGSRLTAGLTRGGTRTTAGGTETDREVGN